MSKIMMILATVAMLLAVSTMPTQAGITHKHEKHTTKERLKDGLYHTKTDSNHADHNVEFDHEAIIGNVKEAEEFDTLSPEESKKRLLILAKMMDLNYDRHIARHELKAWIIRSFKKLSEEEASDRFEAIDENGDGQITWKEYTQEVYSMEGENFENELLDVDEEEQKLIRDDKEIFSTSDANRDGMLSFDEFVLFYNPEEHPQMLPLVLDHAMRDKDKNNDGKIDFKEFVFEGHEHNDKEWLITEKERFDKDFDLNKDGFLTGNEIISWIVPSNEQIAEDEVDHLFVAADEDHNDLLSFEEILNNHETFVGSDATDFGDHLKNIHRLSDEL